MPSIAEIWEKIKEHNVISGILIFDLISFFSYLLDPFKIIYPGDLDFLFGAIIGAIFSLKYKNRNNFKMDYYKTSIITGCFGGLAAGLSASLFFYPVYIIPKLGAGFSQFALIFIPNIAVAIIIGFIVGILIAIYYSRKKK